MGKTVGNLDKSIKTSLDNDFAPKTHNHNYLPLSGGTLTGHITMTGNKHIQTIMPSTTGGWAHGYVLRDTENTANVAGFGFYGGANKTFHNMFMGYGTDPWSPSTGVLVSSDTVTVKGKFKMATARTLTVGNTGKSFDGSANVSWSLAEIGAATPDDLNNLSIGGRNYILDSKKETTTTSTYQVRNLAADAITDLAGKTVTVSFDLKGTNAGGDIYTYFRSSSGAIQPQSQKIGAATTEYKRYSMTFTAPEDLSTAITFSVHTTSSLGTTYLKNIKLELGHKATSWCYALEEYALASDLAGKANSSHGTHVTWSTTTPKANGTATIGTETKVARGDHVHPLQTSVAQLTTARAIKIGNKSNNFDGTANITYTLADIGALPLTGGTLTGQLVVQTAADGTSGLVVQRASNTDERATMYIDDAIFHIKYLNDEGASSIKFTLQNTDDEANAGAGANTSTVTISGASGKSTIAANYFTENGTSLADKYAAKSHGTHVTWSTTAPKVAGTAAVGTETKAARGDHVHAAQTSVSGNAGTATKLATARTLTIGNKGKTFDGSANVSWTLAEIGALPLAGGTLTGDLVMTAGKAVKLSTTSDYTNARIGVDESTGDVYIANINNNWFRVKPDKTMTMAGYKVYTAFDKPTPGDIGALPTAGGTMTGHITFNNNIQLKWKTAAEYTNTNSSAAVASGTVLSLLGYNGSGNLHIGSGAYDNYLSTGNVYISSPNTIYYRTRNDGNHIFQENGTTHITFNNDGATFEKVIVAKGGIRSNAAIADDLGTAAIPWRTAYTDTYQIYGEASKQYGYLGATTTGTTSATGEAKLQLGNATATGTASNACGKIALFGTNTGYTMIQPGNNSTSNITVTLPSGGGTLARTSDNVASATKIVAASGSAWTTAVQNPGAANILFHYNVAKTATGLFPVSNNANLIISINKHSGNYASQLGFNNEGSIYYRNENSAAISDSTLWKEIAFTGVDSSLVDATTLGRSGSGTSTADTYASTGKCYKFTSTSTATVIYKCKFAPLHFGSYGLCVRLKASANTSTSNIVQIIVRRGSTALKTVSIKGTQFTSTSQYQNFYTNIDYVGDANAKADLYVEIKSTTVTGIDLSFDYARIEMMNTGVFL